MKILICKQILVTSTMLIKKCMKNSDRSICLAWRIGFYRPINPCSIPLSFVTFRLFCSRSRWKKARLCLRCIVPRNSMKMQVQNIFKAQRCRLLPLAVFFHSVFQGSFSASFPYFCFTALDVKFVHSVLRYSHLFFSSCKTELIHFV